MAFWTEIVGFCTQIGRSWPVFNDQKRVPETRFRYQSPCFQSQTAIFRSRMARFGTCPWLVPCHCCAGHQGGQAKMDSLILAWLDATVHLCGQYSIRGMWSGVALAGFTPGCHPRIFRSLVERFVRPVMGRFTAVGNISHPRDQRSEARKMSRKTSPSSTGSFPAHALPPEAARVHQIGKQSIPRHRSARK